MICFFQLVVHYLPRVIWYNKIVPDVKEKLNILEECRSVQMSWWQCPPLLFIGLGIITIFSLIITSVIASRYFAEPEFLTVVAVSVEAIVFLVIGNIIIGGFNKMAEANRMKTEFISIISHQLRTPLTALQWTLDIIEREFKKPGTDEEIVRSFINTLRDTTRKMTRLVTTLLDVSRVDAKTLILHKQVFSLAALTQEVIKEFSQYASSSNITIRFEADTLFPEISADPEMAREGLRRLDPVRRVESYLKSGPQNRFARVATLESSLYLKNQLLRDADWAGMAHSVEIRTPFVDGCLLKTLASPLIRVGENQKREFFAGNELNLSETLLDRKKTGFSVPFKKWLGITDERWPRNWAREVFRHQQDLELKPEGTVSVN